MGHTFCFLNTHWEVTASSYSVPKVWTPSSQTLGALKVPGEPLVPSPRGKLGNAGSTLREGTSSSDRTNQLGGRGKAKEGEAK